MDLSSLEKPSLTLRIGIGKATGFAIGLTGLVALPYLAPDTDWMFRWGILCWYTTLGAIIGVFGVFKSHPVLQLPFPWWARAPLLGAWMNFVLTLFVHDEFKVVFTTLGVAGYLTSPFWFVVEGAFVGLLIGWLATRFGGEGPSTVAR